MIEYLFKTVLCSLIFMLVYSLFLEREKMYWFNRFYLLGCIIISSIIPLITFTIANDTPLHSMNELVLLSENIMTESVPTSLQEATPSFFNSGNILLIAYWLVTAFFLAMFMVKLYKLYAKIRRSYPVPFKGIHLILIEEDFTPHSFWNYIFLNKSDYKEGRIEKEILQHELTHVKQHHTIDILFIEVLTAFLWFNPILLLFKRAIKLNHEFLADESVINKFPNIKAYQYLILDKTNQHSALAITSQFKFLITKKRLIMITRNTSRRIAILKQSFAITIITVAIFAFSTKVNLNQEANSIQTNKMFAKNSHNQKQNGNTIIKDTSMINYAAFYAGGTKEVVSNELVNEYHIIIERNKQQENGRNEIQKFNEFTNHVSSADRKRLEEIFIQMSLSQQEQERVVFWKPMHPSSPVIPSEEQFNSFKNAKVYGLWINEKKVSNSELNKYSSKDFSHMFISKLSPIAKKGKTYSYQVDLMTNEYYKKYRASTLANKSNLMVVQSPRSKKL